jgi:hypothetical protein
MNKFKKNDRVQFKGDSRTYIVVRFYKSGNSYKYDLASINGKETVIAMPQATLKKKEQK